MQEEWVGLFRFARIIGVLYDRTLVKSMVQ